MVAAVAPAATRLAYLLGQSEGPLPAWFRDPLAARPRPPSPYAYIWIDSVPLERYARIGGDEGGSMTDWTASGWFDTSMTDRIDPCLEWTTHAPRHPIRGRFRILAAKAMDRWLWRQVNPVVLEVMRFGAERDLARRTCQRRRDDLAPFPRKVTVR